MSTAVAQPAKQVFYNILGGIALIAGFIFLAGPTQILREGGHVSWSMLFIGFSILLPGTGFFLKAMTEERSFTSRWVANACIILGLLCFFADRVLLMHEQTQLTLAHMGL